MNKLKRGLIVLVLCLSLFTTEFKGVDMFWLNCKKLTIQGQIPKDHFRAFIRRNVVNMSDIAVDVTKKVKCKADWRGRSP